MPFNPRQAAIIHSVQATVNGCDVNGRFRVTSKLRRVRRAWVNMDGLQGSGEASVNVVGISGITAVVQIAQPKSGASGLDQNINAVDSTGGYSGNLVQVWFEGDGAMK